MILTGPPLPQSRGHQNFRHETSPCQPTIPVWENQSQGLNSAQNQWFKSGPSFQTENCFPKNDFAAWSKPLTRDSQPKWGSLQMKGKMQLAMELVQLISQM